MLLHYCFLDCILHPYYKEIMLPQWLCIHRLILHLQWVSSSSSSCFGSPAGHQDDAFSWHHQHVSPGSPGWRIVKTRRSDSSRDTVPGSRNDNPFKEQQLTSEHDMESNAWNVPRDPSFPKQVRDHYIGRGWDGCIRMHCVTMIVRLSPRIIKLCCCQTE